VHVYANKDTDENEKLFANKKLQMITSRLLQKAIFL
jgi:hypothetical protein